VESPDEPGVVDSVCRGVRNVPGAGVEEVRHEITLLVMVASRFVDAPGGRNELADAAPGDDSDI
jgi:hypothetical protein